MSERRAYTVTIRNQPTRAQKSRGQKVGTVYKEYVTEPMMASAEQLRAWVQLEHKNRTVTVIPHR